MKKIVPLLLGVALTAAANLRVPRSASTSEAEYCNGGRTAANPERLKELRQQLQNRQPCVGEGIANRVAEATPRKRILWGRRNALYTAEKVAKVPDCWSLVIRLLFSRHAAMRPRLRRFSSARHRNHSSFLLDLSALNGL